MNNFSSKYIKEFQDEILNFYYENGRHNLSIRESSNPYQIHVSEIMSSQTQIERVEKYFKKWIQRYPTPQDVAYESNSELLKLWQGLGYNSRVLNLKEACKQIVEEFDNHYPQNELELQKLKGVGPYVASAILSFAYNQEVGVVDTNIRRILIHFKFISETTKSKDIQKIAKELCPKGKSKEWNNALMDYGALKLTAKKSGIKPIGKQGKFLGSSRYIRSLIVKECLRNNFILVSKVENECKKFQLNSDMIIKKLQKESVIKIETNKIYLIE